MLSAVAPATASAAAAAAAAATFVGLAVVRRCCAVDVPVLSHCSDFVGSHLLPRLSTLRQGYRPPLLHLTGLLQSRLADLRPPPAEATPFVRETIPLPALSTPPSARCCPELVPAGLVSIDWLDQPDATAPICLLIPGLTGSSDSAYVRRTAVALHAAGVLHRDIKAANVLLDDQGHACLADFGLARLTGGLSADGAKRRSTKRTSFAGTLEYMAPEMLRKGAGNAFAALDWWSLGIVRARAPS